MPRLTRYALYYRLMDICFIIQIVSIVLELVERTANGDAPFGPLSTVVMAFQLSAVLIPIVLIFFRSMRDDFAEELWQKTAGTVLKALTFLPIIAAVVFGLLIGTGTVDIPGDIFAEDGISDVQGGAIMGAIMSLTYVWVYTPMVFTVAFQWHRWRASR